MVYVTGWRGEMRAYCGGEGIGVGERDFDGAVVDFTEGIHFSPSSHVVVACVRDGLGDGRRRR